MERTTACDVIDPALRGSSSNGSDETICCNDYRDLEMSALCQRNYLQQKSQERSPVTVRNLERPDVDTVSSDLNDSKNRVLHGDVIYA